MPIRSGEAKGMVRYPINCPVGRYRAEKGGPILSRRPQFLWQETSFSAFCRLATAGGKKALAQEFLFLLSGDGFLFPAL